MSNPLSNYSVHYCDSNRGVRANLNISDRYRNPVYYEVSYNFNNLIRKPEHRINEQRTKHLSSVHSREDEELKPADYYTSMLLDEINLVKMRIYNESIPHWEELVNVHRFFFKEAREWLFQKEQTSHLAMEYFVQTIMRCPNLKRNEMGIIAVTSLLLASKFDEIDYSLVSSYHLKLMLETSPYLSQYENKFQENDILGWERSIWRRLNWNFHQFTPYHFLQTLLEIGITQKEDYIQDYWWTENSIPERGDISSDPRNLAKRKLNEYSSKYSDYKSTTSNTDCSSMYPPLVKSRLLW